MNKSFFEVLNNFEENKGVLRPKNLRIVVEKKYLLSWQNVQNTFLN